MYLTWVSKLSINVSAGEDNEGGADQLLLWWFSHLSSSLKGLLSKTPDSQSLELNLQIGNVVRVLSWYHSTNFIVTSYVRTIKNNVITKLATMLCVLFLDGMASNFNLLLNQARPRALQNFDWSFSDFQF